MSRLLAVYIFLFGGKCSCRLFCRIYGSNVGIRPLVPVQETFHIDDVANLKIFNGSVHIGGIVTEIGFYRKRVCSAVQGYVKVQVVPLLSGTVPFIQECRAAVVGRFNGHAFEGHIFILVCGEFIGA